MFVARRFAETCVIRQRAESFIAKIGGERINRRTAQTIDDSTLVFALVKIFEKLRV